MLVITYVCHLLVAVTKGGFGRDWSEGLDGGYGAVEQC